MQIHMKNIDEQNYRVAHDFIATNMNDIDMILNLFWLHKINFVINWQKRRWFFRKSRANCTQRRKIEKIHEFEFSNQKINVKHDSNKSVEIFMLIDFVDAAVFVQMCECKNFQTFAMKFIENKNVINDSSINTKI